jgi:MYXO-CTERM domain-containing protein
MPTPDELSISLPRGWPRCVTRALLHVVGLERIALAEVRAGLENSQDARAQLTARVDRAEEMVRLLPDVIRILLARLEQIPPLRRPHYPPAECFAILKLRTRFGWTAAETAWWFGAAGAGVGGSGVGGAGGSVASGGTAGSGIGGRTSAGGSAATGGSAPDAGEILGSSDDGGCGCRQPGGPRSSGPVAPLILLALALLRVRRRRGSCERA